MWRRKQSGDDGNGRTGESRSSAAFGGVGRDAGIPKAFRTLEPGVRSLQADPAWMITPATLKANKCLCVTPEISAGRDVSRRTDGGGKVISPWRQRQLCSNQIRSPVYPLYSRLIYWAAARFAVLHLSDAVGRVDALLPGRGDLAGGKCQSLLQRHAAQIRGGNVFKNQG